MPVKKRISKKSPKAKSVSLKQNKQPLLLGYGDKAFWVNNGPVLQSLRELETALVKMTEEQFRHHVDTNKNDFASWIEEVLRDKACARDVRLSNTIDKTIRAVEKHLKKYVQ